MLLSSFCRLDEAALNERLGACDASQDERSSSSSALLHTPLALQILLPLPDGVAAAFSPADAAEQNSLPSVLRPDEAALNERLGDRDWLRQAAQK